MAGAAGEPSCERAKDNESLSCRVALRRSPGCLSTIRPGGPSSVVERRIPAMQDEHVSIWVVEETHQADAGVNGIPEKLDSVGDELLTRNVDVRHAERDARGVR